MLINKERLANVFTTLCEIDSPSKKEGKVAAFLKKYFAGRKNPPEILEDGSSDRTGSDCGNLIVRFKGSLNLEPVFFNCHMDTVLPAVGVKVRRENDTFYSKGSTVLGGDDKAGIAMLLEVMTSLQENNIPHGPVEYIFTTCEEVGLLGAKALNPDQIQARMGYALDSTGTDLAVIGAPAANYIYIDIKGIASHAGLNPENGINAIHLAAQAISTLKLGRIDHESTANIGLISGGTATNIIPEQARVEGEVRSHSMEKLKRYTQDIKESFQRVIEGWSDSTGTVKEKPSFTFAAPEQYPALMLQSSDPVLQRINQAATKLSREINYIVAGGGSDANILNGYGLQTAILGIGMRDVHTTDENINLRDMVRTAELIHATITG